MSRLQHLNHRRMSAFATRPWAMSILEVTIAAAMLTILLTVSAQMMRAVGSQQRAAERRALAVRTVQALAEQIGNVPWEELTAETAGRLEIPAAVAPHLPKARLSVVLNEESQPVAAKRVTIELQWSGASGQPAGPARLTTWVFRNEVQPQEL